MPAVRGPCRSLLRGVMLRRTKASVEDQLQLPPCSREDMEVRGASLSYLALYLTPHCGPCEYGALLIACIADCNTMHLVHLASCTSSTGL